MSRRATTSVADRPNRPGRVGEAVPAAGRERRLAQPAHERVEVARRGRSVVDAGEQAAPTEIDVVGQADRDRQRRERLGERPVIRVDRRDARGDAGWEREDRVAGAESAALDPAGVGAVVRIVGARPG